jgi:hypothetical protein
MQAWQVYIEEFRRRAADADERRFGRQELLTEAAHDAYEAAANRLTREYGWSDEHTLVIMRGLNAAVQNWLDLGGADWDTLIAQLQRREEEMKVGFSTGTDDTPKPAGSAPRG